MCYSKEFKNYDNVIKIPKVQKDQLSAWHLYNINIDFNKLKINKNNFIKKLYEKGIVTQVHYIPIFKQPAFKKFKKGQFKNANSYFSSCLSLPIFYDLSIKQAKYIATTVKLMVKNCKK